MILRGQTLYEARWIIGAFAVLTGLFAILHLWGFVGFWILCILYTLFFFRDPDRVIPPDPSAIVAAADGLVVEVQTVQENDVTNSQMRRVAIFLSVFDVHVNRSPVAGKITYSHRKVGKCLDARDARASLENECRTWGFESEQNGKLRVFVVRQITGKIARRIVAWSKVGDVVSKGFRFGMIRFGSRTEVYLPLDCEVVVKAGDRVQGGRSVIAKLP